MREHTDLLTLRAQLARAEKQARQQVRPASAASPAPETLKLRPLQPQREAELEGIETGDYTLARAHSQLRDLVYEGHYHVCPHAIQHARAEGFLEHDIVSVLVAGRVRAVYPQERRWLVCGYFGTQGTPGAPGIQLPLHVVVELHAPQGGRPGQPHSGARRAGHLDVVTAFIPKHPHHVISRARLAVMLRYDGGDVRHHTSLPGSRAGARTGARARGKWKKGA